jgi:O-antigen/teichoic acid export membrane protein
VTSYPLELTDLPFLGKMDSAKLAAFVGQRVSREVTSTNMKSIAEKAAPSSGMGIIGRFMHLFSAQGTEAIAGTVFFLYLARLSQTMYGEVMYALAWGSIVMKVVQFGLYYPLVSDLGEAPPEKTPEILNRVNMIKLALLGPTLLVLTAMIFYRSFNLQMGLMLFFMCLGFGMEAFAETFFADLRVRGRQATEARIRIVSSVFCYGYGFATAALGLSPVIVSLFKLVSALVRISGGLVSYLRTYTARLLFLPDWRSIWAVFRTTLIFALIEILGIVYNKTNVFFLKAATGVKGVAYYSATWSLFVDPISTLASEQLLGWVVFPLLATLWWNNRDRVTSLVRNNARWLIALALPIMFFLHSESAFLIKLAYYNRPEYSDAIWMQKYLVWTIPLSFENNLFQYVMMVSGAVKVLLGFQVATTVLNLVFNVVLVKPLGLAGGCLVIILTKLVMTAFTFLYCQIRFHFFKIWDFIFPIGLGAACYGMFRVLDPVITVHPAVALTLAVYSVVLWKMGPKFLGGIPRKANT